MNLNPVVIKSVLLTLVLIASGGVMANPESSFNLSIQHLDNWLNGYKAAWEMLDADKAASLFTENAIYQEDPYKEPFQGRDAIHNYWSTVTADQANVKFTFETVSVTGNSGVAHWHSEFKQPSTGSTIILDGIFILEFSKDGLCESLKEWWHFQAVPANNN